MSFGETRTHPFRPCTTQGSGLKRTRNDKKQGIKNTKIRNELFVSEG